MSELVENEQSSDGQPPVSTTEVENPKKKTRGELLAPYRNTFKPGNKEHRKRLKIRKDARRSLATCIRKITKEDGVEGYKLINALYEIAMDDGEKTRDRVYAIEVLLDRGFGKAPLEIDIKNEDKGVGIVLEQNKEDVLGILAVLVKSKALGSVGQDGGDVIKNVPCREVMNDG